MPSRFKVKTPYAEKLEAIRKGRGQSVYAMAKQLGLEIKHVWRILQGEVYPGYETASRLAGWALENKDYSKAGRCRTTKTMRAEPEKWSTLNFRFSKRIHQRLRTICDQWHISQGTFIQLALERLLDNEGALKGYEMAIKKVARIRLEQAIVEAPGMQDILDCEVPWAVKLGGRGGHDASKIKEPNPHEVLEAVNVDSEGAVSEAVWWPDSDDSFEEFAANDVDTAGEIGDDA